MNPRLWFYDQNIHIFPTFDKVPAVKKGTSQFDYRCSREQAAAFKEYGVPLGLFAVADSDSPETEIWNAAHLPDTPFKVTTGPYHNGAPGRGRHRYYRLISAPPSFIHRDGHTIEFRNRGAYVVGPDSTRPDGIVYTADDWSWNASDVPFFPKDFLFDDGSCGRFSSGGAEADASGDGYEFPEEVHGGRRHWELHRLLRSWKGSGLDINEAREVVHLANEARCHPPLAEDAKFEKWFTRQWNKPDRPFKRSPEIPATSLEPSAPDLDVDLTTPGDDI